MATPELPQEPLRREPGPRPRRRSRGFARMMTRELGLTPEQWAAVLAAYEAANPEGSSPEGEDPEHDPQVVEP